MCVLLIYLMLLDELVLLFDIVLDCVSLDVVLFTIGFDNIVDLSEFGCIRYCGVCFNMVLICWYVGFFDGCLLLI